MLAVTAGTPALAAGQSGGRGLDEALRERARSGRGTSRVIVQTADRSSSDNLIRAFRGKPGRRLVSGLVAEIPNAALESLAARREIGSISLDRPVHGSMERTGTAIGATWVRDNLGLDGSGVGVAIIDSGVASWHDDLGSDRVVHFADFVDFLPAPYDDYGHGTHVAGIVAGSGYDSGGARRGIAPNASLIVLKVLDGEGNGHISNVIAALDYAVENRSRYNIRVVNLSVAAGVYESFNTDPLAQAAKRAVSAGVVVVTAAGNFGKNAAGQPQYGGITAPGNAPWVLTVGASSHNGTVTRADDAMAGFSSRGPGYIDYMAKPDLVAPGVGIESLTHGASLLYSTHPAARLWGTLDTATQPYLSLSGTSMAAPVVTGTIALMLQANPALTPNLVKAILQYTAEHRKKYDALTQGAGFLNARGAVQLARALTGDQPAAAAADPTAWSAHIIWGNHRIGGGLLKPDANAWRADVMWGAPSTALGEQIIWGTVCEGNECDDLSAPARPADRKVWGTSCSDGGCADTVWGTTVAGGVVNVVWGASCAGADCDNIVWGTSHDSDNIVWGTSCESLTPSCGGVVWQPASPPPAQIRSRGSNVWPGRS